MPENPLIAQIQRDQRLFNSLPPREQSNLNREVGLIGGPQPAYRYVTRDDRK
jgi:hypothetical protein